MELSNPPDSSVELAVIASLVLSVLGEDTKVLKAAIENGANIADVVSTSDLKLIRIRHQSQDDKVRRHFAEAAVWLRLFGARFEQFQRLGAL